MLRSVFAADDAWQNTRDVFVKDAAGDYWFVDTLDALIPTEDGPVAPTRVAHTLQRIACVDLAGRFRGETANFDALDSVEPRIHRERLELLPQLAEAGLVTAGKDISMAGLLGTLLMLLETSGCGAELDLAAVPAPEAAEGQARRWLEAFPSYGFLLAAEPEHVGEICERFAALGIVAEAFDMLEEDLEEERFFVAIRKEYWAAADGSPIRKLCERLIDKLDF